MKKTPNVAKYLASKSLSFAFGLKYHELNEEKFFELQSETGFFKCDLIVWKVNGFVGFSTFQSS